MERERPSGHRERCWPSRVVRRAWLRTVVALCGLVGWIVGCAGEPVALRPAPIAVTAEQKPGARHGAQPPEASEEGVVGVRDRSGRIRSFEDVTIDIYDEDPVVRLVIKATYRQRDRGARDIWLSVAPPEDSVLERVELHDGERWRALRPEPRWIGVDGDDEPREAVVVAPAALQRRSWRIRRVEEATEVRVRAVVSLVRAGPRQLLSLPKMSTAPARKLQARVWDRPAGLDRRDGPPRPAWNWSGAHVSSPSLPFRAEAPRASATGSAEGVIARILPLSHDHRDPWRDLVVAVDTSASQGRSFEETVRRVGALLDAIAARADASQRVWVVAFDQRTRTLYRGPAAEIPENIVQLLLRRQALGASDLGQVFDFIRRYATEGVDRMLLVSDGLPTVGETSAAALADALERLRVGGLRRLDVMHGDTLVDLRAVDVDRRAPRPGLLLDGGELR